MNLQNLQAQLAKTQRRHTLLQKQLQRRTEKQFTALPGKVGLKSVDALILELAPHASPRLRARLNGVAGLAPSARVAATSAATAGGGKSKGTRYAAATKAAIRQALEQGGQTVAQVSARFGPSVFSINAWKKAWGLTKSRKTKRAASVAATRSISKPVRYARSAPAKPVAPTSAAKKK